jgi:DNA-binding response OmpR family regulator
VTKVLVIDDDQGITDMLRLALPLKGFKVAAANSGREGIEAVRQQEPDVIILDLMIPDIDGWHVCKAIREFSQIPILVLSAVVDPEKVELVKRQGANAYLTKPAGLDQLVAFLHKLTTPERNRTVTAQT